MAKSPITPSTGQCADYIKVFNIYDMIFVYLMFGSVDFFSAYFLFTAEDIIFVLGYNTIGFLVSKCVTVSVN